MRSFQTIVDPTVKSGAALYPGDNRLHSGAEASQAIVCPLTAAHILRLKFLPALEKLGCLRPSFRFSRPPFPTLYKVAGHVFKLEVFEK
jgi:hypothetical protein